MFKSIPADKLTMNPFSAIGSDWMLITAGQGERCNTMTASWGGVGIMWNLPVATAYIRPQRYTREFVDESEYFSLCFFGGEQREALRLCGTVSGRERAKIAESGLTVLTDKPAPYFAEADTVIICRKVYRQEMKPECFLDSSIERHYPQKDYHIMYLGEIVECLKAE